MTIHFFINNYFKNKTNMKKKQYEKPSVEVVELKQTGMLMSSVNSGDVNATMETEWEEEIILP